MRRQVKNAKHDITEEELDRVVRDPDAAQKILQEQVMGKAHSNIKNAVSDIQDKYAAILKLE
jgi:t-SNARE complex subunit (syntaxin)